MGDTVRAPTVQFVSPTGARARARADSKARRSNAPTRHVVWRGRPSFIQTSLSLAVVQKSLALHCTSYQSVCTPAPTFCHSSQFPLFLKLALSIFFFLFSLLYIPCAHSQSLDAAWSSDGTFFVLVQDNGSVLYTSCVPPNATLADARFERGAEPPQISQVRPFPAGLGSSRCLLPFIELSVQ
jgi:hypothetical protein